MQISSIIIDDEPNNIQNLTTILQTYCHDIHIVAIAYNADDGIAAIKQHDPELVFLDIQMPVRSGFDVLTDFPNAGFEVIFITAYDQYGIRAIKFSALDYLLKPVDITELKLAVEKARQKIAVKNRDQKLENLIEYIKRGKNDVPKIALPTMSEIRYMKIDEIVRCEASDNYTTYYITTGERILVCKTLKEFVELLQPHDFIRTHQSHLANIHFVKSYLREDGGALLMKDLVKIPISRHNRDSVKDAFKRML